MEEWNVVLASASPRRRELLAQIGIEAEIVPSRLEEKIGTEVPEEAVMELSRQKAEAVAAGRDGRAVILGADTVVAAEGRILGKPDGQREAARMVAMLAGKTHQVYTGVTLILKEGRRFLEKTFAERTDVTVYPMSPQEIEAYSACGEPLDKAGAYGIQGKFAAYVKGIDGDYSNVVGLPVGRVYQELKQLKAQWENQAEQEKENHD